MLIVVTVINYLLQRMGMPMFIIKSLKCFIFALVSGFFLVTSANSTLLFPNIDLGGGSTADIHVEVFENSSAFCEGLTTSQLNRHSLFAVHGLGGSAGVWLNLANALFDDNPTGGIVCKVYAIEMPGHGGSGLPTNILFGQLSHVNYANAILNTLTALADLGIRPISYISHSNGALNLQVAQQILVDADSSFSEQFGAEKITFLAGVPSRPVSWPDADGFGDFLEELAACFSGPGNPFDPGCDGFDFDPDGDVDWDDIRVIDPITVFDCDPLTVPVGISVAPPDCENPSTLGDRDPGIIGNPEPLNIIRAVFDAAPQIRPITQNGIFGGSGATLQVVSFEMDTVVGPPAVHQDLFNHLTNGINGTFFLVEGPGTGHFFFDVDPEEFLDLISGKICLIPLERAIPTLSEWGLIVTIGLLGIISLIALHRRKVRA